MLISRGRYLDINFLLGLEKMRNCIHTTRELYRVAHMVDH